MKIWKYFLAVVILNSCIYAQGGSVYSRFGVGELYFNSAAKKNSIGELGTSLFDNSYLSSWNPASWTGLQFTRFSASADYNGIHMSGNSGSAYYSEIEFTGFMFAFPVSYKNGITISGGLTPYSKMQYEVKDNYDTAGGYNFEYQGNGSLSKLYLGGSYRFPFDLSIGLSLNYYLGNYNYFSRLKYSNGYSNSEFNDNLKMRGLGLSIGLISPDLAKGAGVQAVKDFRLGVMLDLPATLEGDSILTAIGSIENVAVNVEGFDVELPMRFSAGLSFIYDDNYQFILDYLYQPWSEYKFNGYHDNEITDFHKFSLGVASVRKTNSLDESFWEHMSLRGGLSYELMQYDIAGERLKEFSIFGGFSIPLGRENNIDISLQYGMRGSKNNNLLEEKIFKVGATLSFAELWFVSPGR